jgi:branched-subunit amino acid transport protein
MTILLIILGCALVTYLPRMLPMVVLKNIHLPPFIQSFLRYIPYAALGALIFPGILSSAGNEHTDAAITGGILCAVLAWFRLPILIVIFSGIICVFLWQVWIS